MAQVRGQQQWLVERWQSGPAARPSVLSRPLQLPQSRSRSSECWVEGWVQRWREAELGQSRRQWAVRRLSPPVSSYPLVPGHPGGLGKKTVLGVDGHSKALVALRDLRRGQLSLSVMGPPSGLGLVSDWTQSGPSASSSSCS